MPVWDGTATRCDTWNTWNEPTSWNCSASTTIWANWSTAATYNTTVIWPMWTADVGTNYTSCGTVNTVPAWREPTPEEREAERQASERWRAQQEEQRRKREQAQQKAKAILEQHLTEEQRAQLARDKFFVVQGSKGRQYRVRQGRSMNVDRLDEAGQPIERLCAHPAVACPDEDTMLVQKLHLEHDEEDFYRIANKARVA